MSTLLKINGREFSPHLRVNQGEGLNPYDSSALEPQFSQNAAGEGEPLISLNEGNRELQFPVVVTPSRDTNDTYAATKDGLHKLIRDINRTLKTAPGKLVEWRDEGATESTFFDVGFAKLEPDFDFRRAAQLWLAGTVHVWARPYGHTATTRVIATAARSIPFAVMQVPSGALEGDVDARAVFEITATSAPGFDGGVIAGVSVAPASAPLLWLPASQVSFLTGGSLVGASGAIASQVQRVGVSAGAGAVNGVTVRTPTGALPAGRYRVLAAARLNVATSAASAVALTGWREVRDAVLGATQMLAASDGWRTLDFGIMSSPSQFQQDAEIGITGGLLSATTGASGTLDIGAMMMLPEDSTVVVALGNSDVDQIITLTLDDVEDHITLTNTVDNGFDTPSSYKLSAATGQRGPIPQIPIGSGRDVLAFILPQTFAQNPAVSASIRVRERFEFAR